MTMQSLAIEVHERRPHHFEVSLAGRLDTQTEAVFTEKLGFVENRQVHALHLELGRLSYISSVGLRSVMTLARAVRAGGGTFSMSNLQAQIAKVFEIANVLPQEEIFASVAEADRYFDAIQRQELAKHKPPSTS
jgi:anti-sigma B factor antagonist